MEEISLRELFDYYKSKINIIFITVFLALAIGSLYTFVFKKSLYKSNTTILFVDKNTSQLVNTYSGIIKSRDTLDEVIGNLNLNISYGSLSSSIQVKSVDNSEIIDISVSNEDKLLAKEIVNEIAIVFVENIKDTYNLSNVSVLDKGVISSAPYNSNILKEMAMYLFVGMATGLLLIFVMYYFNDTVLTVRQIENKYGIPVLGKVPSMEED